MREESREAIKTKHVHPSGQYKLWIQTLAKKSYEARAATHHTLKIDWPALESRLFNAKADQNWKTVRLKTIYVLHKTV